MNMSINWKKLAIPVIGLALITTACNGESDRNNKAQSATTTTTAVANPQGNTQQSGVTVTDQQDCTGAPMACRGLPTGNQPAGPVTTTTVGSTNPPAGNQPAGGSTATSIVNGTPYAARPAGPVAIAPQAAIPERTPACETGEAQTAPCTLDVPAGSVAVIDGWSTDLNGGKTGGFLMMWCGPKKGTFQLTSGIAYYVPEASAATEFAGRKDYLIKTGKDRKNIVEGCS